jgi:hypothetical protein
MREGITVEVRAADRGRFEDDLRTGTARTSMFACLAGADCAADDLPLEKPLVRPERQWQRRANPSGAPRPPPPVHDRSLSLYLSVRSEPACDA